MGQGESKINGSFAFAYSKSPRKRFYLTPPQPPNDNFDCDLILTRPEIYGLDAQDMTFNVESSSLSSLDSALSTRKYQQRYDSGYISSLNDESKQLASDLAYVDQIYYPTRKPAIMLNENSEDSNLRTNQKGNFEISITDILLASPDGTLDEVYLSNRSIYSLSTNISVLTMIRKLDLSNNQLTEIPESVGYMQNLESLLLAKNRLRALPDTICYLTNLLELDVSFNEITDLTPHIGYLEKLKTLNLSYNQITRLPTEIRGLVNLISLELGRNPLTILPAEVSKLPILRRMRLDECPLNTAISYSIKQNPPSLLELCARTIVKDKMTLSCEELPNHLMAYINSAKSCTACLGPYFESFVLRGRLLEKIDAYVPLEYTLCSSHWLDEEDRICSMFSSPPENSCDSILLPKRPSLPDKPLYQTKEKLSLKSRRTYYPVNTHCQEKEAIIDVTSNSKMTNETPFSKSSLSRITSKLKRPNIPW